MVNNAVASAREAESRNWRLTQNGLVWGAVLTLTNALFRPDQTRGPSNLDNLMHRLPLVPVYKLSTCTDYLSQTQHTYRLITVATHRSQAGLILLGLEPRRPRPVSRRRGDTKRGRKPPKEMLADSVQYQLKLMHLHSKLCRLKQVRLFPD